MPTATGQAGRMQKRQRNEASHAIISWINRIDPVIARLHRDAGTHAFSPIASQPGDTHKPSSMNPVALVVMAVIAVGYVAAMLVALHTGTGWVVALLAILVIALFVRWR